MRTMKMRTRKMRKRKTQASAGPEVSCPPSHPQDLRVEYGEGGPLAQVTWRHNPWIIANSTPPVHDPGPRTPREAALPGYQEGHLNKSPASLFSQDREREANLDAKAPPQVPTWLLDTTNTRGKMGIVGRKVKLNQPFCGIFVKKDDKNQTKVIKDRSELYPTGTFAQIVELQDLGTRVRIVPMAHRRIKLLGQVVEEAQEVEMEVKKVEKEAREALKKAKTGKELLLLGETEIVGQK